MMMAQPIPRIKTGPLTKFTDWMKANKKKMAEVIVRAAELPHFKSLVS